MGSVQIHESGLWVRCFDGTEMEYETFSNTELQEWFESGLNNGEIAGMMGAEYNDMLDSALIDKRADLTEEEF